MDIENLPIYKCIDGLAHGLSAISASPFLSSFRVKDCRLPAQYWK